MRPIRYLILLLTISATLVVALVKPLPTRAGNGSTSSSGKRSARQLHRRRRRLAARRAAARHPFGERVVKYARRFLGTPYVYGGSSPRSGFDCSGFVRYVYDHFGISLPHSSYADRWRGRGIPRRGLREGDLVFFDGAGHVGIYVGGGRFIHAPHTGTVVQITTLRSDWYAQTFDGARRIHAYR
jgi:cell wall-associated NlpC family hydrolase